jgi:hypothetical protein
MSDYDDWEYHNVCPWCDELYKDVNHQLGCPDPKPEAEWGPRAKRLKLVVDLITSGEIEDLI